MCQSGRVRGAYGTANFADQLVYATSSGARCKSGNTEDEALMCRFETSVWRLIRL